MNLFDLIKEVFSRSKEGVSENAVENLDKIHDVLPKNSKQRIEESFEKSESGDITDPFSENGNLVFDLDDAISIIVKEASSISLENLDLPDLLSQLSKESSIISDGGFTG